MDLSYNHQKCALIPVTTSLMISMMSQFHITPTNALNLMQSQIRTCSACHVMNRLETVNSVLEMTLVLLVFLKEGKLLFTIFTLQLLFCLSLLT